MPRGGRRKPGSRPQAHPPTCPSCEAEDVKVRHGHCEECTPTLAVQLSDQLRSRHSRQSIRKYGITPELHARLFFKQKGLCAICRHPGRSRKVDGQRSGLLVDHDHKTGEVRGLLCQSCNLAIGFLADNPAWLEQASDYLRSKDVRRRRGTLQKMERRIEQMETPDMPAPAFMHEQAQRLREEVELREEIEQRTKNV